MSPRTGRPKSENPKAATIKFRADEQTVKDLDYCCERLQETRSEILRRGIALVKDEVTKK